MQDFILSILTTIALLTILRRACDYIRALRYEELRTKRDQMTLPELREDLDRQYYSQIMREMYHDQ